MGKPFKIQYDFAHHVLIDWNNKLIKDEHLLGNVEQVLPQLGTEPNETPFRKIYMVGDNPESDIKGANDNGWESVLLRTGVYKDDDYNTMVAKPTVGVLIMLKMQSLKSWNHMVLKYDCEIIIVALFLEL